MSLEYATTYPDRVSAMLLYGTFSYGQQPILNALASVLTGKHFSPDVDRQVRLWGGNLRDNQDLQDAFLETLKAFPQPVKEKAETEEEKKPAPDPFAERIMHFETYNFAMSHNQPRYDVRPKLGTIQAPTLIVVGRNDNFSLVSYSEEMNKLISGSELAVFENSGHYPEKDEPDAYRKRVTDFLAKHEIV